MLLQCKNFYSNLFSEFEKFLVLTVSFALVFRMRVQCILCILVVLVGLIGSQLSVNQALIAGFAGRLQVKSE